MALVKARDLIRLAEEQGFWCVRKKKGVAVYGKRQEDGWVMLHLTCSDHRALKNAMAHLKKIGVEFK